MAEKKSKILVVDDDPDIAALMELFLLEDGFDVSVITRPKNIVDTVTNFQPDCVLLDIMMPDMDGLEICALLRQIPELAKTKIIVVSFKAYESDKRQAFNVGADGYIVKPIKQATFVKEVRKLLENHIEVSFWGVRGTLPVSGAQTLKYGGNTNCVSASFADGSFFIFDAGTGIKNLSNHLIKTGAKRINAKWFISHPHWDHINSLPFFKQLYMQGNSIEILGPATARKSIKELVSAQMDDEYFPITVQEFAAHVTYRDLREETIRFGDIQVRTMLLSHPGNCLGYRIDYHDKSLCYITDNELYLPGDPLWNSQYVEKLTDFISETNMLIIDSTYTDEEYVTKIGWGHSSVSQVAELAMQAEVKQLCLYHHDPDQDDVSIDEKHYLVESLVEARGSPIVSSVPAEGSTLLV